MDAKTAREEALKVHFKKVQDQYSSAKELIHKAARSGQFQTSYYDDLLLDTKNLLENEGYEIHEHSDQRDGTTITIKW